MPIQSIAVERTFTEETSGEAYICDNCGTLRAANDPSRDIRGESVAGWLFVIERHHDYGTRPTYHAIYCTRCKPAALARLLQERTP